MAAPRTAPALSVGFVLVPDFTMLALAGFVDTLRLAADEGDRSRPIACRWTVMTDRGDPVRASNGVRVQPDSGLTDPAGFDYLVVVGGTLHRGPEVSPAVAAYLARAAMLRVPLVGLCTGSFVLARAGLMHGRRCCVSWFHKSELEAEHPGLDVVADELFVVDRDRITCAGGSGVIHLASHLIDQHLGAGSAAKGLRIMLEDRARPAGSPQPPPLLPGLAEVADPRVRRAMLLIERHLLEPQPLDAVARAVGATPRHLSRLFVDAVGRPPAAFREELRLHRAHELIVDTRLRLTEIATRCGYADASHLTRRFRARHGATPTEVRARQRV